LDVTTRWIMLLVIMLAAGLSGCSMTDDYKATLEVSVMGEGTTTPAKGTSHFVPDTLVELQASPAAGWVFSHWQGEVADPKSPHTSIVVGEQAAATAVFVPRGTILEAPGGLIYSRTDGSQVTARPGGTKDIEYIMVHAMSDAAANPADPYRIDRIRTIFHDYAVESHYVIDRLGRIYQFVEDGLVARHAGRGAWGEDPRLTDNMNRYAVGIELLGIGTDAEMIPVIGADSNSAINPSDRGYTEEQYNALRQLIGLLQERYSIPRENIIGHRDYAPTRKWDPGVLFDWSRL
jgi:hypothetical protein